MTRWLLIVLHAVLGVAALGAGQAFVRDPSGTTLGMTTDWLAGSPFPDFRVPGLFLTFVIGGANLLAAVLLWRRHPRSPLASLATGLLLVAWVAIQTAIIGFRHWSQSIWWVSFVLITLLATRLVRQHTTPARGYGPPRGEPMAGQSDSGRTRKQARVIGPTTEDAGRYPFRTS